jgi:adenylate cyclase
VAASRRLAAVMFTDLVGFTASTRADEAKALDRLREQEELVRPVLGSFGGREVKSTGDGFMVEFPSALKAVECAAEIQRRLSERNAARPSAPIELRIGIHVGDVEDRGGDIFGDSVNVAARVVPIADPGGVCLTEEVVAQVRNKLPYGMERLGPKAVKGIPEGLELFRVVLPWTERPRAPSRTDPLAPSRIAVLPLANISPDPNDAYFADGLTEELISVLSKIRGLRVIARTSVLPYRGGSKSIAQIGAELEVGSILEGSVRKAGDRIRVTLQLIDVPSQEHTWADSYDRKLTDVFAIQSEVAEATAGAIRLELAGKDRTSIRRGSTSDMAAYELYLRALQRGESSSTAFHESVALLEQAIRRDPEFGLAYARLAYVLIQGGGDWVPHREAFDRARVAAQRALELDPDSSEAHTALADVRMQADHDWAGATAEFERALALNPSNAAAHLSFASLLRTVGRPDEAMRHAKEAAALDPHWVGPRRWLAEFALYGDDLDAAIREVHRLIDPDPQPELTHINVGLAYAIRGRREDARRELELAGPPTSIFARLAAALLLATIGERAEADRLLAEVRSGTDLGYIPADFLVALHVAVGDTDAALSLLERAASAGESGIWLRYLTPLFDPVRSDPRFLAVLRSMRLPESVIEAQARRAAGR